MLLFFNRNRCASIYLQLSRLQQREICLATMLMIVVLVFFACNVLALVINVMEVRTKQQFFKSAVFVGNLEKSPLFYLICHALVGNHSLCTLLVGLAVIAQSGIDCQRTSLRNTDGPFLADLVLKSKKHLFSSSLPPPFHTSALDSFPNLPFLYISRREKRPSFLFRLSFLGWKGKGVILHSFRCTYSLGLPIKLRHSAALRKSRISAGLFWRAGREGEFPKRTYLKF